MGHFTHRTHEHPSTLHSKPAFGDNKVPQMLHGIGKSTKSVRGSGNSAGVRGAARHATHRKSIRRWGHKDRARRTRHARRKDECDTDA